MVLIDTHLLLLQKIDILVIKNYLFYYQFLQYFVAHIILLQLGF